jgi:hypothetical protein
MEMPSSIAVATRGTIRPTFTSSSVNCGMALIALGTDKPADHAVDAFYRAVKEKYPYPTRGARELTAGEVVAAATEGAQFAAERWGVEAEELERIEESGRVDLEPWGGAARLRKEIPALTWQLARLRFGTVGPTNHFVELQQVEEILDPEAAELLGVRPGQVTLQYHAGGGVLTGEIGHLFQRRKDTARTMRAVMAVQKPLYHLASARSAAQLRERMRLYFARGCAPVDLDSTEGQRLMLANAAAMNYGYAFRVATYAALRRIALETFGGEPGRLVVDSAQLVPRLSRRTYAGRLGVRDDRPGRAPPGHPPDLVVPRGRGPSERRQPALGLSRRGHHHRPVREGRALDARPRWAHHAPVPLHRRVPLVDTAPRRPRRQRRDVGADQAPHRAPGGPHAAVRGAALTPAHRSRRAPGPVPGSMIPDTERLRARPGRRPFPQTPSGMSPRSPRRARGQLAPRRHRFGSHQPGVIRST